MSLPTFALYWSVLEDNYRTHNQSLRRAGISPESPRLVITSVMTGSAYCRKLNSGQFEVTIPLGLYVRAYLLSVIVFQHLQADTEEEQARIASGVDVSCLFDSEFCELAIFEKCWTELNLGKDYVCDMSQEIAENVMNLCMFHEIGHIITGVSAIERMEITESMLNEASAIRETSLQRKLGAFVSTRDSLLAGAESTTDLVGALEENGYAITWLETALQRTAPSDWCNTSMKRAFEHIADNYACCAMLRYDAKSSDEHSPFLTFQTVLILQVLKSCADASHQLAATKAYPPAFLRLKASVQEGMNMLLASRPAYKASQQSIYRYVSIFADALRQSLYHCTGVPVGLSSALGLDRLEKRQVPLDIDSPEIAEDLQLLDELFYAYGLTRGFFNEQG